MSDPSSLDEVPPTVFSSSLRQDASPAPAESPARPIGRYRIDRLLGRGGMGSVYLAHDPQVDRWVALKVPHFGPDRGESLERFYREARTAGRLQHPNICPVFDVGEADGVHYLSMAFIEGEPLSAHVKDYANRPPRDAAGLVRTLALALEEAHQKGIIHRDLKPANVMINLRGEPIVMDFGLAREVRSASPLKSEEGAVFGTPAYMAPEQARGDVAAIGPGCDVYSLGVVLYELLAGKIPFDGPTMDVLVRHIRDEPPRPSLLRPDLDPHIEAICLKALAKEPSRRFLSMADFAHALEDYASGDVGDRSALTFAESDPVEQAAADVLLLLRTWGWRGAVDKLADHLNGQSSAEAGEQLVLLRRWLQGEEEARAEASHQFKRLRFYAALSGWALVGAAFIANREHHFARAESLLREAVLSGDPRDNILQAGIAHQRGFWLYHAGRLAEALAALHEALALCGRDHFLTTMVLDTLGLVYAKKNNFHTARQFFEQAIAGKRRFGYDRAVVGSLHQLVQLYLDWESLEKAEDTARQALDLALRSADESNQASAFDYLGVVALARGQRETQAGHRARARRELTRAHEWLEASSRAHAGTGRRSREGIAHRDRALAYLAEDNLEQARRYAGLAQERLQEVGHYDRLARLLQVRGILARKAGDFRQAEQLLRQALAHFDGTADYLEGTRTQWEIARTLAAATAPSELVTNAFLDALKRAEACRRTGLVRAIEEELKSVDEEAHWRHVFQRARGGNVAADTSSLTEGASESATVLFLNLQGFMPFCQGLEPEEVMQALNQLMADLDDVLDRFQAQVTAYLGGGFMAVLRGTGHAPRAVDAALDLIAVVDDFNRPRAVLGLAQLPVRIGVASGTVFLGNIGTYRKMDFTAIGNAVNLASRLVRQAQERSPCISRETHELIGARFHFAADSPRALDLLGIGRRKVWSVTGRKQGLSSRPSESPR